jgi:hypothetical protein
MPSPVSRHCRPAAPRLSEFSYSHDVAFGKHSPNASANWVGAGFSPIPNGQIGPGPIGIGYFLLGVVPFLVGNTVLGY